MKHSLILLTAFFIFSITVDTAAQSGRNKQAVPPKDEPQSRKTLSISDKEEIERELQRGIELYLSGQYGKAGNIFIDILEMDERNQRAWFYLGLAYARTGRNESAERAFAISEKLPPAKSAARSDGTFKPVEFISVPRVSYTKEARRSFVTGTVKVAVEFGADGKIGFIYPIKGLPFGLTEMAIKAAQEIKFKPAQKDGKPITTIRTVVYGFGV